MLEYALRGDRKYWTWLAVLAALILLGFCSYLRQYQVGLSITGMSRDITWGFYIAQFTFLVGIAASAVMVVLPYYLHNWKVFGRITALGEFVAISAVILCMLFILVDMGQPARILNVLLYPSPRSMMFWDMIALSGYLLLNVLISRVTLDSERKGLAPPAWIRPVIILSIPWAISIHTVTAFLYAGLSARPFWMTAVLAPRFLASAFASGPALLILLVLMLRKLTGFDAGREPVQKLALIVTYALCAHIFLILMELFTVFYSGIPEHMSHFQSLLFGSGGWNLMLWEWASMLLAIAVLAFMISPRMRSNERVLSCCCLALFLSIWLDKGMAMIVAGFIPSPLGRFTPYLPTLPELLISAGIYGIGAFLITIFFRIFVIIKSTEA
jgi:molybdopterin-containing oxidoreductase family membrane subunit